MADYHMWFWHAAYGYAGTLNDLTILSLSPFLEQLVNGSFEALEKEAGVCPFEIGADKFEKLFILVDGIYPHYTRFVHGIKVPASWEQKKYTKWQEACRKDIERAFGVLQGKWQCLARPMHQMELGLIGARVSACLILHNMCVSDRVMEDVRARYTPDHSVVVDESVIEYPTDLREKQGGTDFCDRSTIGGQHGSHKTVYALTRQERWQSLKDTEEFRRLHIALQREIASGRRKKK